MKNIIQKYSFTSISNFLTVLMAIGTLVYYLQFASIFSLYTTGSIFPDTIIEYIRLATFQFIHGGVAHFFSNAIFLILFGNIVEKQMGSKKFLLFFLGIIPFQGLALLYFSNVPVIGMSGFAMAILGYYIVDAFYKKNPEYQAGILLLIINLAIGFQANISFLGHFFGALYGILFFFFLGKK